AATKGQEEKVLDERYFATHGF
ncbi:hypothetical protein LCGC14_3167710, partial [marine sediment metagenome]